MSCDCNEGRISTPNYGTVYNTEDALAALRSDLDALESQNWAEALTPLKFQSEEIITLLRKARKSVKALRKQLDAELSAEGLSPLD